MPRIIAPMLAALALALALPGPGRAQQILQAVLLELTAVEVQVMVAAAEPADRVECLLRDGSGRTRSAGSAAIATGLASGRITTLSIALPLLDPGEREFSVLLRRGETVLHETAWKPITLGTPPRSRPAGRRGAHPAAPGTPGASRQRRRRASRVVVLVAGLVLALSAAANARASEHLRGLAPDDRHRLLRGETVAYRVPEALDSELSVGLAFYTLAPLSRVAEALARAGLVTGDRDVVAHGLLDGDVARSLARLAFAADEAGEARDLLDASPGGRFNLSQAEIDAFRALRPGVANGDLGAVLEAVSSRYRAVLLARWHAFQTRGLAAIPPYQRRGTIADPGAELRAVTAGTLPFLTDGSRLEQAWLADPEGRPATAMSHVHWLKRTIQGRPALVLAHALVDTRPDLVIHVERHFYVSHSYNSSLLATGAVPYHHGTLVFSTHRISTEQVTGMGGDLKRALGRRHVQAEIRRRFERVRVGLVETRAPQSP